MVRRRDSIPRWKPRTTRCDIDVHRRHLGSTRGTAEVEALRLFVSEIVVARVDLAGDENERRGEKCQAPHVAASKVTVPSRAIRHARMELK